MQKILLLILFFTTIMVAQQVEEFRAVKITDVDSPVLFNDNNIAAAMDYLASINVNVVLPVVLNGGWTQYQSNIMDSLFGRSVSPKFTGRDPLERLIIEAHRNGIEVLPWFEYGFAAWYSGGTAPFGGHILAKYPEWALRTPDGNICTKNGFDWMSAINPEVQDFINSLAYEVITNYDVDGVEFSDRIPALPVEGGYDPVTVNLYKSEHDGAEPPLNYNDEGWKRWRADKMNNWYNEIKSIVKNYDPHLFVSSSPSLYPWAYNEYLQDSKTWVDSGIVDHVIPQLYRYTFSEYLQELNLALNYVPVSKRDMFFSAILMNIGTGSNAYVMTPDYLKKAIKANRERGVYGEAFFFYEGLRKNNDQLGDTLLATYYKEPAIIPGRGHVRRPKADITDEQGDNAIVTGDWEVVTGPGHDGSILWMNDNTVSADIEYNFIVKADAFFDVYLKNTPATTLTKNARITLWSKSDSMSILFDQSNVKNSGWTKLGTIELEKGENRVARLDNSLLEEGKYIAADAMMLMINRKLSPDAVITSVEETHYADNITPGRFILHNNYPNPFNPGTNIKFYLDKTENVSLEIFDILGRKIETMFEGVLQQGEHGYYFDATSLTSGIYLYKISVGSKYYTGKMMLVK